MLPHEQLKLLMQDPSVPLPIHHLPLLQPLQLTPPFPAEAVSSHQLGQVFHGLLGELYVQASGPPACVIIACL